MCVLSYRIFQRLSFFSPIFGSLFLCGFQSCQSVQLIGMMLVVHSCEHHLVIAEKITKMVNEDVIYCLIVQFWLFKLYLQT